MGGRPGDSMDGLPSEREEQLSHCDVTKQPLLTDQFQCQECYRSGRVSLSSIFELKEFV